MWFKKKKKPVEALVQQELEQPEQDFDLDEIMKEYADQPAEEAPESAEEAAEEKVAEEAAEEEVAEEVTAEEAAEAETTEAEAAAEEATEAEATEEAAEEASAEEVTFGDTVVLPEIIDEETAPAIGDDTMIFEAVEEAANAGDDTVVFDEADAALLEDTQVIAVAADRQTDAMGGDTIELPALDGDGLTRQELADIGDTVVMKPLGGEAPEGDTMGDTVRFDPVTAPQSPEAEAFGEGWEPEYEQPMGVYVAPQPIAFRPKSRLRELKRKLVAGPERRYYELSERGCGRLQISVFVCLVVALITAGATALYAFDMISPDRLKLVVFGQLLGMLVCALLGTFELMDGVEDIFKGRFSLNSLLIFSFIACVADGVFCLREQRIPCCAAFSIQMTMSLWSAYHRRSTEIGQMDTMRKATHLDGIVEVADYRNGVTGLRRCEGQVEDFMDHYRERSTMDKVVSIYSLCALGVSLVAAVVTYVLSRSVSFAVQVVATSLLAAVPGTFFITLTRPMAILEKRLHKLGTVLCGWKRIDRLAQKAVFPIVHQDLFPEGYCSLNGVKFFGDRDPDQVVAYATAVISADGGGLTGLFEQLLDSRQGRHYDVENLRLYGDGGLGGEVCGEPVLVGVPQFLRTMGVEIPDGTMVERAVYVAVDGVLSGLFAVTYEKCRSSATGLDTLCSYRDLQPVLVSADFMLTDSFVRDCFGVNTRRMAFPDYAERAQLASIPVEQDLPSLALISQEGLAPFAFAITGARAVRTASRIGMWIHLLGGVLGMGIVTLLAVLGAAELLTPVNMLLFQLIWIVPGLLVTEWTRSV